MPAPTGRCRTRPQSVSAPRWHHRRAKRIDRCRARLLRPARSAAFRSSPRPARGRSQIELLLRLRVAKRGEFSLRESDVSTWTVVRWRPAGRGSVRPAPPCAGQWRNHGRNSAEAIGGDRMIGDRIQMVHGQAVALPAEQLGGGPLNLVLSM